MNKLQFQAVYPPTQSRTTDSVILWTSELYAIIWLLTVVQYCSIRLTALSTKCSMGCIVYNFTLPCRILTELWLFPWGMHSVSRFSRFQHDFQDTQQLSSGTGCSWSRVKCCCGCSLVRLPPYLSSAVYHTSQHTALPSPCFYDWHCQQLLRRAGLCGLLDMCDQEQEQLCMCCFYFF